jgi:hypothetical protein
MATPHHLGEARLVVADGAREPAADRYGPVARGERRSS